MIEGKTIAITRSEEDAEEFIQLLSKEKAKPITLPTIELISKGEKIVHEFLDDLQNYNPDYTVFMSSKAVKLLFDESKKISLYEKLQLAIANTMVIAVGPKTKAVLEGEGIKVAYMPNRYSSVGVGEVLSRLNAVGKKVIVPRSGASTPFLKNLLEKIGLEIKEIYLYDVCAFNDTTQWNEFRELFSKNNIDGIVFTSASSVQAFFEIMTKDYDQKTLLNNLKKIKVVAIGPFTAEELKKFQVENIVAPVHTVSGAFETIKNLFSLA
ncbi:MAG TPA: uroporphyrinogen-III synthase [Nitrosopumilaceae archaeon]|nr:uroporphyrinogen-III synthase [Nitrosopumilaceae archaeon]